MRQYVIGNDIEDLYWDVFAKYELPEDFTDAQELTLIARHSALHSVCFEPGHTENENRITIKTPAAAISKTGVYDLELTYKKPDLNFPGNVRSFRVTYCQAFEIVSKSCEVELPEDPLVLAGIIAPLRGYSAYEVFVKNGFPGTEAEWEMFIRQPALDAAGTAIEAANLANSARLSIQNDLALKIESETYSPTEYNEL